MVAPALHDGALVGTDHDLLGPAKASNFDFLKLHAKIFHHSFTAGQHGDVLEHCFAAIAVSRALTAAICNTPRSLLMTSVDSASPVMSSAMIKRGFLAFMAFSSSGTKV